MDKERSMSVNEEASSQEPSAKQPARAGRNRIQWAVAGVAVVAVAAAAGWWWASTPGGSPGDKPTESAEPDPCEVETGVTSPAQQDDDAVEVVDVGVDYVSSSNRNVGYLSFGVVLENTSPDAVPVNVSVQVAVYDADDQLVEERRAGEWQGQRWKAPHILPDDRFGFGGDGLWAFADRDDSLAEGNMRVEAEVVEVEQWWPIDNDEHEFAALKAVDLVDGMGPWPGDPEHPWSIADDYEEAEGKYLGFVLESDYCDTLSDVGASTVFRNPDGDIIGGVHDAPIWNAELDADSGETSPPSEGLRDGGFATAPPGASDPVLIYPTVSALEVQAYVLFQHADPAKIEIYPYPT